MAALAVACAVAPAPARAAAADAWAHAVADIALHAIGGEDIPGISVAVVRSGRLVLAGGYGLRDRARRLPADAGTRYGIGSVTKTLVAALALQLAAERALSLDDRVGRWLPTFAAGRDVRVRDLLDQRSGLSDYNSAPFLATVLPDVVPGHVDRAAILDALGRRPLAFAPGTRFAYSNANYLLLGALLERVTGTTLPRLLQQRIFGPLGMNDTDLALGPGPDDARGYTKGPFGPIALGSWDPELTYGAGGVRSTVTDLARFDIALAAGRVVPPRYLSMVERAAALDPSGTYRFGSFAYRDGSRTVLWHDGTVLGFKAMNVIVPASHDAIVVLANADYAHAPAIAFAIGRTALGLTGGGNERVDLNLPRWSEAIGAALALVIVALGFIPRRHRVVACALALVVYATGAIWLPAGISAFAAALALLALLRLRRARSPSR